MRFDRANWLAQEPCNLVIAKVLDMAEDDRHSLSLW
jgi:hypothetical protein